MRYIERWISKLSNTVSNVKDFATLYPSGFWLCFYMPPLIPYLTINKLRTIWWPVLWSQWPVSKSQLRHREIWQPFSTKPVGSCHFGTSLCLMPANFTFREITVNPGEPMGSLMDFTLSNARQFYLSTWKVLGFSGVKLNILQTCSFRIIEKWRMEEQQNYWVKQSDEV